MLSQETVKDIARDAAIEAEELEREPLSIYGFDPTRPLEFIRRIPFLGDYCPGGWEHRETMEDIFVDASGFGGDSEPALSIDQFIARLKSFVMSGDNYGFGIIEAGQFQVYIRVYTPHNKDFTGTGHLTSNDLRLVY